MTPTEHAIWAQAIEEACRDLHKAGAPSGIIARIRALRPPAAAADPTMHYISITDQSRAAQQVAARQALSASAPAGAGAQPSEARQMIVDARQMIVDYIEAIERGSTTAPVVETLRAILDLPWAKADKK